MQKILNNSLQYNLNIMKNLHPIMKSLKKYFGIISKKEGDAMLQDLERQRAYNKEKLQERMKK